MFEIGVQLVFLDFVEFHLYIFLVDLPQGLICYNSTSQRTEEAGALLWTDLIE